MEWVSKYQLFSMLRHTERGNGGVLFFFFGQCFPLSGCECWNWMTHVTRYVNVVSVFWLKVTFLDGNAVKSRTLDIFLFLTPLFNLYIVYAFCVLFYYLVCIFITSYVLFYFVCIAFLRTLVVGLLARSRYTEGTATGHLDTSFSWFPCV